MASRAEIRMAKIAKEIEAAAAKSKDPPYVDDQEALSWTDSPPGRNWAKWWIGALAVIGACVLLLSCATVEPPKVAQSKPSIPRDIRFFCHPSGDWAVISESAGEAVIHQGAAPCGKKAI